MYQKEKQKDIKNEKTDEGEAQLRTKIPDTHYVRVMLKTWECNSCLAKEEKQRKDVNTNLGMMLLPGALVRENTRIKKILFWHIFIHKRGLYRISHHR